jgi:hydroxymethylbilane synthase
MTADAGTQPLRIGTRGSQLARAQTQWVIDRLTEAHPDLRVHMEIITTSGDRLRDQPLPEVGGKGLFTLELEAALLEGRIDLAVHSAKDLPTRLTDGLELAAFPVREDPRDAWLSTGGTLWQDLPAGSVVGTGSLRRQAQIRMCRADLQFTALRGNVDTRIKKIQRGDCAGAVLAMAGLKRVGLEHHVTAVLALEDFLSAPGQGALAIETRADDARVRSRVAAIHDQATGLAVRCERAVLAELDAGCRAPVAIFAEIERDQLRCRSLVIEPTGKRYAGADVRGATRDLKDVVRQTVGILHRGGAGAIIAECKP